MFLKGLAFLACMLAVADNGPTQAGEVPEKIERFLKHCETSRRGAILRVQHALRGLRNQAPATRETTARIADLEDQLRVLRSQSQPVVPQLAFPPQIGAIGRLPGLSCHIEQVISDDEFLARTFFPVVVRTVQHFQPRRETVVRPVRLIIRGLPTEKLQEGADSQLLQVFEIAGKDTYQTVDGKSIDLLTLNVFDMKRVEPYFRKMVGRQR